MHGSTLTEEYLGPPQSGPCPYNLPGGSANSSDEYDKTKKLAYLLGFSVKERVEAEIAKIAKYVHRLNLAPSNRNVRVPARVTQF